MLLLTQLITMNYVHRLEQMLGIRGTAVKQYKFVHVNNTASKWTQVHHGVPQGSVLGPIWFTPYMLPLGNTTRKQNVNFSCYADDTKQVLELQECLKTLRTGWPGTSWSTHRYLYLFIHNIMSALFARPYFLPLRLSPSNFSSFLLLSFSLCWGSRQNWVWNC